jgi:hypothetical protein
VSSGSPFGNFFGGECNFSDFELGLDATIVRFEGLLLLKGFIDTHSSNSRLLKGAFLAGCVLLSAGISTTRKTINENHDVDSSKRTK